MRWGIIKTLVAALIVGMIFLTSCDNGCNHNYCLEETIEATCTKAGHNKYVCNECGNSYNEAIPANGHIPGDEPTLDEPQICLVCNKTLAGAVEYMKARNKGLAINHYRGTSDNCFVTNVDTQNHEKYKYEKEYYLSKELKPLSFEIPIQGFYTHSILSDLKVKNVDGRYYTTDSGFKVSFNIEQLSKKIHELNAYKDDNNVEFKNEVDSKKLLRIVRSYKAQTTLYGEIYELVDFANCYIEIAKRNGDDFDVISTIQGEDWKLLANEETIEISDKNGRLFFEPGVYRVLFKYSMMWVSNPVSGVSENFNEEGTVYPYGYINDQYDFFYVNVTGNHNGILLPSNSQDDSGFFAQVRADAPKLDAFLTDKKIMFENEIESSNAIFKIATELDMTEEEFYYKKQNIESFSATVSYRAESNDEYKQILFYDLMSHLNENIVLGEEIELQIPKMETYRGKEFKITISYSTTDENGNLIEKEQNYEYSIDW